MNVQPTTPDLEEFLTVHPASPLFARLAERLLNSGEITRALFVCEKGLGYFPHYSTGWLIQARCHAARSDYQTAVRSIDTVIGAYPGNILLEKLRENWNTQPSGEEETVSPPVEAAPLNPEIVSPGIPPSPAEEISRPDHPAAVEDVTAVEVTIPPEIPPRTDETRTTEEITLPEEVARVSFGISPGTPEPAVEIEPASGTGTARVKPGVIMEDRIVSRTLAEIYASQGAILEAVETYRLLVAGVPEKREMYQERLDELEEYLRTHPGTAHRPSP